MTGDNYIKHFKNLGKLAYFYDSYVTGQTTQDGIRAAILDQAATGLGPSLPVTDMLALFNPSWENGAAYLQALAISIAKSYLALAYMTDDFVSSIPADTVALTVLTALAAEMTTNSKTLTTKASSGIVNFLDAVAGTALSWNTEAGPNADYDDSVYCVLAVV